MSFTGWWNTSTFIAKLGAATSTLAVIAIASFFIHQWQIPDDAVVVRTELGQFIYNERPEGISVFTPDSFVTVCNFIRPGTTLVQVMAMDTLYNKSEPVEIIVISNDDSTWWEPWPKEQPEPTEPGYYFAFDEGGGDTTWSNPPTHHIGLLVNTTWAMGKKDGCISFFMDSALVSISPMDSPSPDSLIISCWINVDNFNISDARIISKANGTSGTNHWWMISTFTDKSIRFRLKTDGVTTTLVSLPNVLSVGTWHYIICRYNGAMMSIYVDNIFVGSTDKTGAISQDATIPVAVGNQPQYGKPFHGRIDELRIR